MCQRSFTTRDIRFLNVQRRVMLLHNRSLLRDIRIIVFHFPPSVMHNHRATRPVDPVGMPAARINNVTRTSAAFIRCTLIRLRTRPSSSPPRWRKTMSHRRAAWSPHFNYQFTSQFPELVNSPVDSRYTEFAEVLRSSRYAATFVVVVVIVKLDKYDARPGLIVGRRRQNAI